MFFRTPTEDSTLFPPMVSMKMFPSFLASGKYRHAPPLPFLTRNSLPRAGRPLSDSFPASCRFGMGPPSSSRGKGVIVPLSFSRRLMCSFLTPVRPFNPFHHFFPSSGAFTDIGGSPRSPPGRRELPSFPPPLIFPRGLSFFSACLSKT